MTFDYPAGADTLSPEHSHKLLIFIAYPLLQVSPGPGFMYWLKTLLLGAGKIGLQLDICMSPAALAAECAAVQRAIRSGVTGGGRLSHLERPLWEFYRYLGRELGIVNATSTLASAG